MLKAKMEAEIKAEITPCAICVPSSSWWLAASVVRNGGVVHQRPLTKVMMVFWRSCCRPSVVPSVGTAVDEDKNDGGGQKGEESEDYDVERELARTLHSMAG